MARKMIFITAGILAGVLYIRSVVKELKADRAETEKRQQEAEERLKDIRKEMVDEAVRHEKEMNRIRQEGENKRQRIRDEWMVIKYEDKDGVIHEIKYGDHEAFYRMMEDRSNRLIFD